MSSGEPKVMDPRLAEQVTEQMKEAVVGKAVDGKITCAVLRKLGEDMGISYQVIGTAADLAGVRVHDCGLGCF